jgi:hypothetical protein
MQLIAYGAQDLYLTGDPSMTYFKMFYRRHTNFAMESISMPFQTNPKLSPTDPSEATVQVGRHGDLLSDSYLVFDLPDIYSNKSNNFKWVDYIGHQIIDHVELLIEGQLIDRQYGQWMTIWNELTLPIGKKRAFYDMIGNVPELKPNYYSKEEEHLAINGRRLYIPLDFWFCKNSGLAIPLISLQYNVVYIRVEFSPLNSLFTIGSPPVSPEELFSDRTLSDSNLLLKECLIAQGFNCSNILTKYTRNNWAQNTYVEGNFIYLDTEERKKFAGETLEYLIPQMNRNMFRSLKGGTNTLELEFNHPSKELFWVYRDVNVSRRNDWRNFTRITNIDDWEKLNRASSSNFQSLEDDVADDFLDSVDVSDFVADTRGDLTTDGYSSVFNGYTNVALRSTLIFDGRNRFEERDYVFFEKLQVYKYHTSLPLIPGINVYSFAQKPEKDSPSGTFNFSRIDKAQFQTVIREKDDESKRYDLFFYSRNYNILRITGGLGGPAWAN